MASSFSGSSFVSSWLAVFPRSIFRAKRSFLESGKLTEVLLCGNRIGEVCRTFKNYQFSLLNVPLQWIGETGRRDQLAPAKRDLRWRLDLADLSLYFLGEHGAGLPYECAERLGRCSPDKSGH